MVSTKSFFYSIVQPRFQFLVLLIVLITTLGVAYYGTLEFYSLTTPPDLLPLVPKDLATWGESPTKVNVGLSIIDFPEFDIEKNIFIFDGVLWFEFDPTHISLDIIKKFSFENGEILYRSEPETKLINGNLLAQYTIRVRFKAHLNYQLFPFDDHRIYISLINPFVLPRELIMLSHRSNFTIAQAGFTHAWHLQDWQVRSGYVKTSLDKYDSQKTVSYPKVVFWIDFERIGLRNALLVLLPLFLIFYLSLFALGLDPETRSGTMFGLASGSITALVGYRFVIQSLSPDVGYFVLSDHIFILFLTCIFCVFGLVLALMTHKFNRPLMIIRGGMFLLFHIIFLIFWFYLLFFWSKG